MQEENVFPAQAGVIRIYVGFKETQNRLSRASGGDPRYIDGMTWENTSFPRKRG